MNIRYTQKMKLKKTQREKQIHTQSQRKKRIRRW